MSAKMMNGVLSTDVSCSQNQSNSQILDSSDKDICKKKAAFNSDQMQSKIQCPYCTKLYKQKYILNTHIKSVHKKNPHYCSECQESYGTIQEYKDHICKALHPELNTDNKVSSDKKQSKFLEKNQQNQVKSQLDISLQYKNLIDSKICQQIETKLNETSSKIQQEQVQKNTKINQNPAQQINEELIKKLRNQNTQNQMKNLSKNNLQQGLGLNPFLMISQQNAKIQAVNNSTTNNNYPKISISPINNDDSTSFLQDSIHQNQVLKNFNLHSHEEESSQTQLVQQLEEDKNKLKTNINLQQNNSINSQQQQQYLQQNIYTLQQQLKNETLQKNLVQQLLQKQQENYLLSQLLQKQQQIQQFNVFGLGVSNLGVDINQQNLFQQQNQIPYIQHPSYISHNKQPFLSSLGFNNNINALNQI